MSELALPLAVVECVAGFECAYTKWVSTPPPTQDVTQSLEQLKAALLTLSGGARRLAQREQAEEEVTALQRDHEQRLLQASEKQVQLEELLSLWQR